MIRNFLEQAIGAYRKSGQNTYELQAFRARDAWDAMVARGEAQDVDPASEAGKLILAIVEIVPRGVKKAASEKPSGRRGRKARQAADSETAGVDQSAKGPDAGAAAVVLPSGGQEAL